MSPFDESPQEIDFDLLSTYLKALAHPGRLEILWGLRAPRNAAELEVRPRRKDAFSPERAMSRQTVHEHLGRLEEVGVVNRVPQPEGGADRWVANAPHVFALMEELRKITAIPPAEVLNHEATSPAASDKTPDWPAGAKLVLLAGPWEGRVFALAGTGPWTLGRSRAREIALTYDPFVSAEHAVLSRATSGFEVKSGEGVRNPPSVNFRPLSPGLPRRVSHGDVLTMGRSQMVFHER